MHKQDDSLQGRRQGRRSPVMTYPDTASGSRLVQSGRADIMLSGSFDGRFARRQQSGTLSARV